MAYEENNDEFVVGLDPAEVNTENVPIKLESSRETPVTQEPKTDIGIDVDIVDDTPEEDRGRTPLPESAKEEALTDKDIDNESKRVQKRINELKKQYHDERRRAEAAVRERDEAANFAKLAYQDKLAIQEKLRSGEAWAIDQAKKAAAIRLESAKKEFIAANESGDSEKLADAQQAMNFAAIEFNNLNSYVPQPPPQQNDAKTLQPTENIVYKGREQKPEAPPPDPKAEEWAEKNSWFRTNRAMRGFALGVHEELVDDGVEVGSDDYYNRIDARMKQQFRSAFAPTERKPRLSTVVAPVGQNVPDRRRVVLTKTQATLARKLGITPEQYAEQLVVIENNARSGR